LALDFVVQDVPFQTWARVKVASVLLFCWSPTEAQKLADLHHIPSRLLTVEFAGFGVF
jgi:hypothetical protein